MTYEEIELGQEVRILSKTPKWREVGKVVDKQRMIISGAPHDRVWVDTPRGGRRICVPFILEAVSDDEGQAPA